jgi:hypothetical protein
MISTARYIYECDPQNNHFGTKVTERENGRPFPVERAETGTIFSKFWLFFFTIYFLYIFVGVMSSLRVNHRRKKMIGSASMIMMVLIGPCFSPEKSLEMRDDAATPSTSLITLLLLYPPNTTYSLTLQKKIYFFFREKYVSPSLARFNDFTWSRVCSCFTVIMAV